MNSIGRNRLGVLSIALALTTASPSWAQTTSPPPPDGLAGLLLRFFSPSNPIVLEQTGHDAHFVSQPSAQATLNQLNRVIATQLSTFPLASSSGGFTFEFDPALGLFERNTESFGPIFAERALTAGKGKFSLGVTGLEARYDKFEGLDLDGSDLQLYLTHEDFDGDGTTTQFWFEGDIIRADLAIDLRNRTTVVVANYGVTDSFDIGVALPFVDVQMNASIVTTIEDVATAPDPFVSHIFQNGQQQAVFEEKGSASGIGDIVLRAKYNFHRGASWNFAGALDLRLPTGNADDLLGSGATQAKLFGIASSDSGRFAPRASAGYTFSTGGADFIGELPDELHYTAGFDFVLHQKVTFTGDFLGRTLLNAERLIIRDQSFSFTQRLDPTIRETIRQIPDTERGDLSILLGSAGIKINPVGQLLLVVSVLFPLNDAGLQDSITPVFGLDYTF